MDKAKTRMTLLHLIQYVHRHLVTIAALESLNQAEKYLLGCLRGATQILMNVAAEANDVDVYAVAEDFEYVVNHIGLANFKAERVLKVAEPKIKALEEIISEH